MSNSNQCHIDISGYRKAVVLLRTVINKHECDGLLSYRTHRYIEGIRILKIQTRVILRYLYDRTMKKFDITEWLICTDRYMPDNYKIKRIVSEGEYIDQPPFIFSGLTHCLFCGEKLEAE